MHFLGLKFKRFSMKLMSSMDKFLKFVPFGMYWRIRPLVFSLVPPRKALFEFQRSVWMCKVNSNIQCSSNFFMCGKLLPIITGDCMNWVTRQQSHHCFFYRIFYSVFHQTHSQKTALSLHQCHNRSLMSSANDCIRFSQSPIRSRLSTTSGRSSIDVLLGI